MWGCGLSTQGLGRSLLTLSVPTPWEGILGLVSRTGHGEHFSCSRGTETLESTCFIYSPQELQLGRAPEQLKLAGSSFNFLFIHSFTLHSTSVDGSVLVGQDLGPGQQQQPVDNQAMPLPSPPHPPLPRVPYLQGRWVKNQQVCGVHTVAGRRARRPLKWVRDWRLIGWGRGGGPAYSRGSGRPLER